MLTKILFTGAAYDTNMMFDAPNSTLVVRTAGRYLLTGRILLAYQPNPAASRILQIYVNAGLRASDTQDAATLPSTGAASQTVSTTLQLNVGDVISLQAFQSTGNPALSQPQFGDSVTAPQLTAELLVPTP
ncbi:hypothetical protein ACGFZK_36260 [Streptomyces sp. NPDC048257]|uniref:hypothetical protein n=1 Tax=Streptomyces sp. NPDC048257 TaxID=3365526 RepID=UPI0037135E3E